MRPVTTGGLGRPAPGSPGEPVQHIAAYVERYEPAAERVVCAGTTSEAWTEAWLRQFDEGIRKPVTDGLLCMLHDHFVSKEQMQRRLDALAVDPPQPIRMHGGWGSVTVPHLQMEGGSQRELRGMLGHALQSAGHPPLDELDGRRATVYLDDLAVSGGRAGRDIASNWRAGDPPVIVLLWASMVSQVEIEEQVAYWRNRNAPNALQASPEVTLEVFSDRDAGLVPRLVVSASGAEIADHLLDRGRQLIDTQRPAVPPAYPLGYQPYENPRHLDGPGCQVVTWRNIPNSAPIALWWEEEDWKPLFPRITNRETAGAAERGAA